MNGSVVEGAKGKKKGYSDNSLVGKVKDVQPQLSGVDIDKL